MTERTKTIKRLISGQVDMGTFGLVELELLDIEKEIERLKGENEWTDINKRKPLAFEKGDWDGLKSELILVKDILGQIFVATMYEGVLDGSEFCNFYTTNDFELINVQLWKPIN